MLLLEPGSDICSFSTAEDSSSGNRSVDVFRILDVDDDDDFEIVERAAAWPEMKAAAMATSREGLMVISVECVRYELISSASERISFYR